VRLLEPRASLPDVPDLPGGLSHPAPAVLQWPVPGRPEPAAEGRGPAGERDAEIRALLEAALNRLGEDA
jgi:hypothetical protein